MLEAPANVKLVHTPFAQLDELLAREPRLHLLELEPGFLDEHGEPIHELKAAVHRALTSTEVIWGGQQVLELRRSEKRPSVGEGDVLPHLARGSRVEDVCRGRRREVLGPLLGRRVAVPRESETAALVVVFGLHDGLLERRHRRQFRASDRAGLELLLPFGRIVVASVREAVLEQSVSLARLWRRIRHGVRWTGVRGRVALSGLDRDGLLLRLRRGPGRGLGLRALRDEKLDAGASRHVPVARLERASHVALLARQRLSDLRSRLWGRGLRRAGRRHERQSQDRDQFHGYPLLSAPTK